MEGVIFFTIVTHRDSGHSVRMASSGEIILETILPVCRRYTVRMKVNSLHVVRVQNILDASKVMKIDKWELCKGTWV